MINSIQITIHAFAFFKIYKILTFFAPFYIKIEKLQKGDDLRIVGPKLANISLWSAVLNRVKKSLSLDLKSEEGREVFLKLVKIADVVLENFRPGVMEKLKLDWNTLKKITMEGLS